MGQLEKYGLYVLCLLIFLIIGVSIWGDPASAAALEPKKVDPKVAAKDSTQPPLDLSKLMSSVKPAPNVGGSPEPKNGELQLDPKSGGGNEPKKNEPKADVKNDGGKTDGKSTRPVHTIKAGDTLESIAKTIGDARLVPVLLELNPKLNPKALAVGKEVVLPTPAEIAARKVAEKPAADSKPVADKGAKADDKKSDDKKAAKSEPVAGGARTYKIEQGDTLEGLAKRLLGNAKRVDDIKALNPSLDPTHLRIGQLVKLPAK